MSAWRRGDVNVGVDFRMRLCLVVAALAYVRRFQWRRNLGLPGISCWCWVCLSICWCGWMLCALSFVVGFVVGLRDLSFSYTPIVKGQP